MKVSTELPCPTSSGCDPRFPQMFAAAAIGIAICDFDGGILEANAALGRILGYAPHDLAGLNPWKFCGEQSLLSEILGGKRGHLTTEKSYQRGDGSQFWGQLTVSLARDVHGEPSFLVALLDDATERRRVQDCLRQAEKMEVIGRLTGGVAHDFNNLLTGILLYCDLLLAKFDPTQELHQHLEEVRLAGEQGAALTQQLLSIVRKQKPEPRLLELNEVVRSSENLLRRLFGEQIELTTILDPATGEVFADPGQLRQILLNLALNARDATQRGGTIRISTSPTRFPPKLTVAEPTAAVSLTIEDNGSGMNAETRTRIFEPFFTTKQAGRGTGMGLATVQRIVDEYGGLIQVASEPGCGTRVEVLLPSTRDNRGAVVGQPLGFQVLASPNASGDSPC